MNNTAKAIDNFGIINFYVGKGTSRFPSSNRTGKTEMLNNGRDMRIRSLYQDEDKSYSELSC
jgi:hypothetical protein